MEGEKYLGEGRKYVYHGLFLWPLSRCCPWRRGSLKTAAAVTAKRRTRDFHSATGVGRTVYASNRYNNSASKPFIPIHFLDHVQIYLTYLCAYAAAATTACSSSSSSSFPCLPLCCGNVRSSVSSARTLAPDE